MNEIRISKMCNKSELAVIAPSLALSIQLGPAPDMLVAGHVRSEISQHLLFVQLRRHLCSFLIETFPHKGSWLENTSGQVYVHIAKRICRSRAYGIYLATLSLIYSFAETCLEYLLMISLVAMYCEMSMTRVMTMKIGRLEE